MSKLRRMISLTESLRILPIAAFVVLPALIVRLQYVPIAPDAAFIEETSHIGDTRAWWKAVFVVGTGLWMAFHMLLALAAGWRPDKKRCIAVALAITAVLLSAGFSKYPRTAWLGSTILYEGGLACIAYLVGLWYAMEIVRPGERLLLIRLIGCVAILNGALGAVEGLGVEFWPSPVGQWLMNGRGGLLHDNFAGTHMASGTLFQPNHFGMFMAMTSTLALAMIFREGGRFWRGFWSAALLLGFASCIFSRSRAAVLTCAVMISVTLVCMMAAAMRRSDGRRQWLARNRFGIALLAAAAALLAIAFVGGWTGGALGDALASMRSRGFWPAAPTVKTPVRSVSLHEGSISVLWDKGGLDIGRLPDGDWALAVSDSRDGPERMPFKADGNKWNRRPLPGLEGHEFRYRRDGNASVSGPGFTIDFYGVGGRVFAVDHRDRFLDRIGPAPAIGFKGLEHIFSNRGYIWSRGLPLAAANPVLGSGPGTFALVFPNSDLFASQAYANYSDKDKAHGIWLSLLVQLGIIGTALFLLPFGLAFVDGVKRGDMLSPPLLLAAAAFMLGSITNDSTVGTSPIFCVILGLAASRCGDCAPPVADAASRVSGKHWWT